MVADTANTVAEEAQEEATPHMVEVTLEEVSEDSTTSGRTILQESLSTTNQEVPGTAMAKAAAWAARAADLQKVKGEEMAA